MAFNWTCPHCSRPQIATDENTHGFTNYINVGGPPSIGHIGYRLYAIRCLNHECNKLKLSISLCPLSQGGNVDTTKPIQVWRLLPESSAIPQPEYIPAPLREDYYEACRIRDLSPKSSATLTRRCLQGMIRDFCGIAKGTLAAEITELRSRVDDGKAPAGVTLESVEAIDQVRSIGNIGAHMEKDINLIVEVDTGEAEALTDLIELLFSEWYVARHERQQKLARLEAIAADKKAKLAEAKAQKLAAEATEDNQTTES